MHQDLRRASLVLFSILFCTVLITGCGPTPDQVVLNFVERIKADDSEGAKQYTTESFAKKLTTAKAFFDLIGFKPADVGLESYTKDNLTIEIKGETARVWRKDKSFLVFVLSKSSGQWKIDGFDTNIKLPDLGGKIREKLDERRDIM